MDTSGSELSPALSATKSVISEEGTEILLHAITGGRQKDVMMILQVLGVDPNLEDVKTGMYPLRDTAVGLWWRSSAVQHYAGSGIDWIGIQGKP